MCRSKNHQQHHAILINRLRTALIKIDLEQYQEDAIAAIPEDEGFRAIAALVYWLNKDQREEQVRTVVAGTFKDLIDWLCKADDKIKDQDASPPCLANVEVVRWMVIVGLMVDGQFKAIRGPTIDHSTVRTMLAWAGGTWTQLIKTGCLPSINDNNSQNKEDVAVFLAQLATAQLGTVPVSVDDILIHSYELRPEVQWAWDQGNVNTAGWGRPQITATPHGAGSPPTQYFPPDKGKLVPKKRSLGKMIQHWDDNTTGADRLNMYQLESVNASADTTHINTPNISLSPSSVQHRHGKRARRAETVSASHQSTSTHSSYHPVLDESANSETLLCSPLENIVEGEVNAETLEADDSAISVIYISSGDEEVEPAMLQSQMWPIFRK